jgi:hypothetical protein
MSELGISLADEYESGDTVVIEQSDMMCHWEGIGISWC